MCVCEGVNLFIHPAPSSEAFQLKTEGRKKKKKKWAVRLGRQQWVVVGKAWSFTNISFNSVLV